MLAIKDGKKLEIKEVAGIMAEITIFDKDNNIEDHTMITGDYIVSMAFDFLKKNGAI